jgi:hypothetical protein
MFLEFDNAIRRSLKAFGIKIAEQQRGTPSIRPSARPWRTIRRLAASWMPCRPTVRTVILRRIFPPFAVGKNRQRFVKDPATGKRVSRSNPESQWIRTEVLHLKVVDDDLWLAARATILATATLLLIC